MWLAVPSHFPGKHIFRRVSSVSLPRPLFPSEYDPVHDTVHSFCDASQEGYAAVLYLAAYGENGHPVIILLSSKTKVAPLKTFTISRMELLGAYLLPKLVKISQLISVQPYHLPYARLD